MLAKKSVRPEQALSGIWLMRLQENLKAVQAKGVPLWQCEAQIRLDQWFGAITCGSFGWAKICLRRGYWTVCKIAVAPLPGFRFEGGFVSG